MTRIEENIAAIVSFVWGLPLVAIIVCSALFCALYSRMIPFRYLGHAINILFKKEGVSISGDQSHWKALCTAMSGTIGMGNVAGVAMAISAGGSGAIFWMWLAAVAGMSIKFFTCSLSCLYRKRSRKGKILGGPMYYIELGMGQSYKFLAIIFAACGMIGCLGVFQSNQIGSLLKSQWAVEPTVTGLSVALIVWVIVRGGTLNVGRFASLIVPVMGLGYLLCASIIIITHTEQLPIVFKSILIGAFDPSAAIGGAIGLSVREIIVTGTKRAIFSNEAGVGTEALAHSTAKTDQPIREGFVGMLGPIIDTHLICTATALVILISGSHSESGILAIADAFEKSMPGFGAISLTIIFTAFGFSTLVTYAFYSMKCASYLFGERLGQHYLWIYLGFLIVAPTWNPQTALNIIDIAFALMVIPNLVATLFLAPKVIESLRNYVNRPDFK